MELPLSEPTGEWFLGRYGRPTPVQTGAWEAAAAGDHLLAVAPTGSGKTFAAFLVALDDLYTGRIATGALRILYISPLKALGADIRENLAAPLRELKKAHAKGGRAVPEIRIGIRNGDTTPYERRRQTASPPEILVTTPESLNILLLSDGGRRILSTVETCIVDEIHALAPSGRGTLLACALERLADLAGEFRRIGLTATVRPLETAAAYLGGFAPPVPDPGSAPEPRPVTIVAPPAEKEIRIAVEPLPAPAKTDRPDPDDFWREIARNVRQVVKKRRSTLAFLDSRRWSEKMARLINEGEGEILAWAHHGSLSKDMRRLVESRLKRGELKAVVATGSLELGIDIGPLDEVLMLAPPSSPSAALQRAGRAGHSPDEPSLARIFPVSQPDLLASAVLAKMSADGEIERLRIPENPLDLLAQTVLALCAEKGRSPDGIFSIVRRAWPFRNLPRESFDSVLAMLEGRYARTRIAALRPRIYRDGKLLVARPGTRLRLYSGGGAIPDMGMYAVRTPGVDGVLGSLDENFVWESQTGTVFPLGNRRWRIVSVDDKTVSVAPTEDAITSEPFWRAEARNRDEDYAGRIADLLERAEATAADQKGDGGDPGGEILSALTGFLSRDYGLAPEPAAQLAEYLAMQRRRTGTALPHRRHAVAEISADPESGADPSARTLFLHTFLGGRVNRPLALALQAAWEEKSPVPILPVVTDDVIAFSLGEKDADPFVSKLHGLADPEPLIRRVLEASPFFGGRFREAAGRAMLLPASTPRRRQPLWMTRQRSRKLMEAVLPLPDFPILAEVWRRCLNDEFAMDALRGFLDGVRSGEIAVSTVRTAAPSPFARDAVRLRLAERLNNNIMDQADPRFVSRLDDGEIRRLAKAGALRPRIPGELIGKLDRRRRRLEEGYAPGSVEALKAWIAEREAFDAADWEETIAAAARDSGIAAGDLGDAVRDFVVEARLGPEGAPWRVDAARAEEWTEAFAARTSEDGGEGAPKPRLADPEGAARLSAFWFSGRGPKPLSDVLGLFGIPAGSPAAAQMAEGWTAAGNLVVDVLEEGAEETGICDDEGMEILLRWRRRRARNADAPLPADRLPAFLARHQGFGSLSGDSGTARVLSLLEGRPVAAAAWETAVLPSRIAGYRPGDLDDLVRTEEAVWVGAGRNRIAFLTAEGGWRYPPPGEDGSKTGVEEAFPAPGDPPRSFWEIADALGIGSDAAVEAVWERVWSGRLTADDAGVLRRAVESGFKASPAAVRAASARTSGRARGIGSGYAPNRGGLRGWMAGRPLEGRWYSPAYPPEPVDPMESDQLLRERIRMLSKRYGVLSKPLLEAEIPPFRWPALSRTLALMELADELIGGMWFEGLPMPQFLNPESLPAWREDASPEKGWLLDAADPASPCGLVDIPGLPPRREGIWIAWDGDGRLDFALAPGRKRLESPGDRNAAGKGPTPESLGRLASLLTEREVSPLPRLIVREWNGGEVDRVGAKALEEAGFGPGGDGGWIYRPRPIGAR